MRKHFMIWDQVGLMWRQLYFENNLQYCKTMIISQAMLANGKWWIYDSTLAASTPWYNRHNCVLTTDPMQSNFWIVFSHWRSVGQRCTGAGASEWTPAGVLTIFENRSGAGVDFFKERLEPELSRSHFLNMRLVCLFLIIIIADCFFTKHVIM